MAAFARALPAIIAAGLLVTACSDLPFQTAPPEPQVATPTAAVETPPADSLSIAVAPVPAGIPAYDRGEWRHWTDEDRDCQDTRQEALIEESTSPVEYNDNQCRVESGEWNGPYTGQQFTDPRDLDIDHMVPLGNAHRSGGWAWSEGRKELYANDLTYPGHLIAVQRSANRAKGADGPEEWRPPDRGYWCQYATDWVAIKNEWGLTATSGEAAALSDMLSTCTPPMALGLVETQQPQPPTPTPWITPTPGAVYASCDEAEAAGETRVQGSISNGRGFPQDMVPSARDGDGDGVVCER